jgi:hypothetical protein
VRAACKIRCECLHTSPFPVAWYRKTAGERKFNPTKEATRCDLKEDSGYTKGSLAGATHYCLDFAHGRCPNGSDCLKLHQVPHECDDALLSLETDVFGRPREELSTAWEKRKGQKEDGCNDLENTTLYVGGLLVPVPQKSSLCGGASVKPKSRSQLMDDSVRKAFKVFGELYETKLMVDKRVSFLTFMSRR